MIKETNISFISFEISRNKKDLYRLWKNLGNSESYFLFFIKSWISIQGTNYRTYMFMGKNVYDHFYS